MRILANHALNPEEGTDAIAARDRFYAMQARRGIQHHVAGRQLHALGSVVVFNDQLSPVVVLRRCEEERRAQIGANSLPRSDELANRSVDMRAEGLAAGVAVEHRGEHTQRKRSRHKSRRARETGEHQIAEFLCYGRVLGDLRVALHLLRLIAGGYAAIGPLSRRQFDACDLHLLRRQYLLNRDEHRSFLID